MAITFNSVFNFLKKKPRDELESSYKEQDTSDVRDELKRPDPTHRPKQPVAKHELSEKFPYVSSRTSLEKGHPLVPKFTTLHVGDVKHVMFVSVDVLEPSTFEPLYAITEGDRYPSIAYFHDLTNAGVPLLMARGRITSEKEKGTDRRKHYLSLTDGRHRVFYSAYVKGCKEVPIIYNGLEDDIASLRQAGVLRYPTAEESLKIEKRCEQFQERMHRKRTKDMLKKRSRMYPSDENGYLDFLEDHLNKPELLDVHNYGYNTGSLFAAAIRLEKMKKQEKGSNGPQM